MGEYYDSTHDLRGSPQAAGLIPISSSASPRLTESLSRSSMYLMPEHRRRIHLYPPGPVRWRLYKFSDYSHYSNGGLASMYYTCSCTSFGDTYTFFNLQRFLTETLLRHFFFFSICSSFTWPPVHWCYFNRLSNGTYVTSKDIYTST